jgi:23S rRNA (guanosine2251-2'-O)-methyltransferase
VAPREERGAGGRLAAGHDEDMLYGRHAVAEALRAGRRRFRRIYVANNVDRTGIVGEIIATARDQGCPVIEVPRERMDDAAGANHQGVVGLATQYPYLDLEEMLAAPGDRLYLVLDHLQDVQNLGTLLRTAEVMAVTGVLLPGRRSAGITPAVVNASAGAVEHLPVALVGNLAQALERMKAAGVWVMGLEGGPRPLPSSKPI